MLKLLAKGSPAEQQIVLAWLLDTRRLLVSLPSDKYSAWIETIAKVVRIIIEIYFTLSRSSRTNSQEKSTHAGGTIRVIVIMWSLE